MVSRLSIFFVSLRSEALTLTLLAMLVYRMIGTFLDLESPTSVVPLLAGSNMIYLVMTEAASPPVVPVGQAREFIQKSRSYMYDDYVYNSPKVASVRTAAPSNKGGAKATKSSIKSSAGNQRTKYGYSETLGKERTNPIQRENLSNGSNDNNRRGYSDMDNDYDDEYRRRQVEWDRQEREARRRERDGTGRSVDGMNKVFDSAAEVGSNLADAAGDAAVVAASTGIITCYKSKCSLNMILSHAFFIRHFICS